jgi:hypothetical protein
MRARLENVALGLWLMFAPEVLGYWTTAPAPGQNDRVVGPLVISFAIAAIWPEVRPLRRLNTLAGAWLAISPAVFAGLFTLEVPVAAIVNSVVVGLAIVAVSLDRGEIDARFGGGWRSLWRDDISTIYG